MKLLLPRCPLFLLQDSNHPSYLNFDILNEDIMVIDDLQNEFLSSELIELYNKSNNKSILHYINGNSHIFKSENVYCANNKVTFYTHLMNILKYNIY